MFSHGQGGSIINIASMSGVIANRGLTQVHYNSSKAGVIHLTKSLAMEWVDRDIRVNAISPGYTATPMNTRPEMVDSMAVFESQTPMQRSATVTEMVGPAIFLASDASSYCTGVDLLVDGGFMLVTLHPGNRSDCAYPSSPIVGQRLEWAPVLAVALPEAAGGRTRADIVVCGHDRGWVIAAQLRSTTHSADSPARASSPVMTVAGP